MPDGPQSPDHNQNPVTAEAIRTADTPVPRADSAPATPDSSSLFARLFPNWRSAPPPGSGESTPAVTATPETSLPGTASTVTESGAVSLGSDGPADQVSADASLAASVPVPDSNGVRIDFAQPDNSADVQAVETAQPDETATADHMPDLETGRNGNEQDTLSTHPEGSAVDETEAVVQPPSNENPDNITTPIEDVVVETGESAPPVSDTPLTPRTYDGSQRSPNEDTFGQKAGFIEEARQRSEAEFAASAAPGIQEPELESDDRHSERSGDQPVESHGGGPVENGVTLQEYLDAVNVNPDLEAVSREIALAQMAGETVQDLVAGAKIGLWVELALKAVEANTGQPIGKEQAAAIAGVVAAGLRGMVELPGLTKVVPDANRQAEMHAELRVSGDEQTRLFYLFGEQAKAIGMTDKKELLGFVLEQYSKFQSIKLTDQRVFVRHALALKSIGPGAMEASDEQISQAEQNVPEDQITLYWQELDSSTRQQRLQEADPGLLTRAGEMTRALTGKFRRAGAWALGASAFVAAVHSGPQTLPASEQPPPSDDSASGSPENPVASFESAPSESPAPSPESGPAIDSGEEMNQPGEAEQAAESSQNPDLSETTSEVTYPNPDHEIAEPTPNTQQEPPIQTSVTLESGGTVWGAASTYLHQVLPGQDVSNDQINDVVQVLSEVQKFGIEAQSKSGDPMDTAMQPGTVINFDDPRVREVIDKIRGGTQ